DFHVTGVQTCALPILAVTGRVYLDGVGARRDCPGTASGRCSLVAGSVAPARSAEFFTAGAQRRHDQCRRKARFSGGPEPETIGRSEERRVGNERTEER